MKMHKLFNNNVAILLSIVLFVLIVVNFYLSAFPLAQDTKIQALGDWYNNDWQYRNRISVDPAQVIGSDKNNFPILLDLSDLPAHFFSQVKTDGSDIVITSSDGQTKLARELVNFDTIAMSGELWFRAPDLSSSLTTDFYIYYGNIAAAEINNPNVWDNNYMMVQHLNQDPSIAPPQFIDSTSNSNNAYSNGSMNSGDLINGVIGKAIKFDGINDYLTVNKFAINEILTISAWINMSDLDTTLDGIFDARRSTGTGDEVSLMESGTGGIRFMGINSSASTAWDISSGILNTSQNYYVVGTSDGVTARLYINGVEVANSAVTGTIDSANNPSNHWRIASQIYDPSNNRYFNGNIDEMRFSNIARDSDWIATEYNNIINSFYNINTYEELFVDIGDWQYYEEIEIKAEFVESDTYNFPIYLDLSHLRPNFFDNVRNDGMDIIVTDSANILLTRELVSINKSQKSGELWFGANFLSSTVDTRFRIYYGNPSANIANSTGLWSSYRIVNHLDKDPSVVNCPGSRHICDSSPNGFHATSSAAMSSSDLIIGKIGNGINFEALDKFGNYGDIMNDLNFPFTISAWVWVDPSNTNTDNCIYL
jgi:hypothetical protein